MKTHDSIFLECNADYSESDIVLFGAPFDSTASYRAGARFAPKAVRAEAVYCIESYSPYQDKDLIDINVYDAGDLELSSDNVESSLNEIEAYTDSILIDNKIPVMLGGEHLITLGAFRAVLRKYPDVRVVHFDAHLDLIDELFEQKLSHGSVIRRMWELIGDNRIYQFGIRSGSREEFIFSKSHINTHIENFDGLDEIINKIGAMPVYFTLDLDVLDSSVLPGTGTPEAGGVTFKQLLEAVLKLKKLNIVGLDIVELCPSLDASGSSTALACKLLREILLSLSD